MNGIALRRSRSDRVLGGVCGGLGRYLNLDPVWVRIFFVALAIADGAGVFIYLLLWVLVPSEDADERASFEERVRANAEEIGAQASAAGSAVGEELGRSLSRPSPRAGAYIGGALIFLGIIFLLQELNIPWLQWLDFDILWPVLLIAGGIVLLVRRAQNK